MSKPKLPPQITEVRKGMDLIVLRNFTDGNVMFCKKRKFHVIVAEPKPTLVCIALHTPLRGEYADETFSKHGFEYCYWVDKHLLIANCREVKQWRSKSSV